MKMSLKAESILLLPNSFLINFILLIRKFFNILTHGFQKNKVTHYILIIGSLLI